MAVGFVLPGGSDKTVIIGRNGSGKTIRGAWVLSRQRFDERPWVALDAKDEEFWDQVGAPPMEKLKLGQMPGKRGLYRMRFLPGQEDDVEDWLWKVWKKENIGLFCDEVTLLPNRKAFKAILRQGRSKHIPIIACTQRPVEVDRELFSECRFKCVIDLDDRRDFKTVQEFIPKIPIDRPLPEFQCYWYDGKTKKLFILPPTPPPVSLAADLKRVVPFKTWLAA